MVLVSPFSFAGGSPANFAHALAEQIHMPVALQLDDEKPVKAFQLDRQLLASKKDFERLMPVKLGYTARLDVSSAASFYHLPWICLQTPYEEDQFLKANLPHAKFASVATILDKGRVTAHLEEHEVVKVSDLESLSWSKPLKVHWAYERRFITVWASNASETNFLKAVAAAVGAKFVETATERRLEFDPDECRRRGLALYEHPLPPDPHAGYTLDFRAAEQALGLRGLQIVSNDILLELFKQPNATWIFDSSDEELQNDARWHFKTLVEFLKQPDPNLRSVIQTYADVIAQIDLDKPVRFSLGQNLGVGTAFHNKVNGGTILI